MNSKSFGTILIILGLLLIITFFVFSEWNVNLDFIENIRYAMIYEFESSRTYAKEGVRLGQALLAPLALISIGYLLRNEIISQEIIKKILPFINDNIKN